MDISSLLASIASDSDSTLKSTCNVSSIKDHSPDLSGNSQVNPDKNVTFSDCRRNSLVEIAAQSLALLAGSKPARPANILDIPNFPDSLVKANNQVGYYPRQVSPTNQLPTPITPTLSKQPGQSSTLHSSNKTQTAPTYDPTHGQNQGTGKPSVTVPSISSAFPFDSSANTNVATTPIYQAFSLSPSDIKSLFDKIAENKNPAKTKRDAAMLCLLLDLKLACQRIADLQYRDIKGILDGTFQGIYRYSHKESIPVKAIQCHWKTAQSLKEWIDECRTSFGWTYDELSPVFVPLACFGEAHRVRRIALKRDAISKVFAALKSTSGISMSKEMINRTVFQFNEN